MGGKGGKGLQLLNYVNLARSALGLDTVAAIPVAGWPEFMSVSDAVVDILGAVATSGLIADARGKQLNSVAYPDAVTAECVSEVLGQRREGTAVVLPGPLDSLLIADAFGLVFVRPGGKPGTWKLSGWIEPTEKDQSVWHLHTLPGELQPAGHEPAVRA